MSDYFTTFDLFVFINFTKKKKKTSVLALKIKTILRQLRNFLFLVKKPQAIFKKKAYNFSSRKIKKKKISGNQINQNNN